MLKEQRTARVLQDIKTASLELIFKPRQAAAPASTGGGNRPEDYGCVQAASSSADVPSCSQHRLKAQSSCLSGQIKHFKLWLEFPGIGKDPCHMLAS